VVLIRYFESIVRNIVLMLQHTISCIECLIAGFTCTCIMCVGLVRGSLMDFVWFQCGREVCRAAEVDNVFVRLGARAGCKKSCDLPEKFMCVFDGKRVDEVNEVDRIVAWKAFGGGV
jgi:hypothetical protein